MTAAELRAETWVAIVRAMDEPRSSSSAVPASWGAIHAAIEAEIADAKEAGYHEGFKEGYEQRGLSASPQLTFAELTALLRIEPLLTASGVIVAGLVAGYGLGVPG